MKEKIKEQPKEKSLEENLKEVMDRFGIDKRQKKSLDYFLGLIKQKDQKTYEHSVRVSLLGVKAAESLGLEAKTLFYAGLLHDLGKVVVDDKIVQKEGKYTKEEMEKMRKHPIYGYYLLEKIHNFSAQILIWHHRFNKEPYPKELPESDVPYSQETRKLIKRYGKILAIIDFYDAALNRHDRKFDSGEKPGPAEVRRRLTEYYQKKKGFKELIDKLYQTGVLES